MKKDENIRNAGKPKNNTSGFKGVSWCKKLSKWRAYIVLNCKQINLGLFQDKDAAALAYNFAAVQYHGEFACLNRVVV